MAIIENQVVEAPVMKDWCQMRLANPQDSRAITSIYKDVYKGTYTYKEYLDPAHLGKDIASRHSNWYVIEDKTSNNQICGCISATVDLTHWRAYGRGMMMRPDWQGRGGASRVFGKTVQHLLEDFKGQIRLLYSETRSTTVKPQAVLEKAGFYPMGILPFKDVFFNSRETPIVMGVYSSKAWNTRETNIKLVPELLPLKEIINKSFRIMKRDNVEIVDPEIPSGIGKGFVDITPFKKKYGYTTYVFTCTKTGESIEIDVNAQCMNAEHMSIHCSKPKTLEALLTMSRRYFERKGVSYMEGYCPASNPGFQRVFIDSGFQPLGYIPAWERTSSGMHVDNIIFGWSKYKIDPSLLNLTTKSSKLAAAIFR